MKTVVVSAVNFYEGGPLTVLRECLEELSAYSDGWRIVALVHDKHLISMPLVELIEFPKSRKTWLHRLFYEWLAFHKLSKTLKPDIWLSLHDITPRVMAKRQYVYCHNPAPFYKVSAREAWQSPAFALFNFFYGFLYSINIKNNRAVIVQQDWLRKAFERRYQLENVIVAYPVGEENFPILKESADSTTHYNCDIFFFPSYPRVFKNFEEICKAASILATNPAWNGEIILTIDGSENRYSSWVLDQYSKVRGLKFIGLQSKHEMDMLYERCDCLLFPSRLETWGLPISEAKALGKPMIVADLPYAHETVGNYDKVKFVSTERPDQLADIILQAHLNSWPQEKIVSDEPVQPFAKNWRELIALLLENDTSHSNGSKS